MSKIDCVIQTKNLPIKTIEAIYFAMLCENTRLKVQYFNWMSRKDNTCLTRDAADSLEKERMKLKVEISRVRHILVARGILK